MAITLTNELPAVAPVVGPDVTLTSLSEDVSSRVLMHGAPRWWWIGFVISFALLLVLIVQMAVLFIVGIGVWGVEIPVAWGLAIAEYVWWIALASGGTIVSALFFLTRSPWRSAVNRIAESMLLSAAPCAGLMPIMHLGRPGFFYWLFPYSSVMGVWPQVRSPLWWDFICLLCYILMSIMYYYAGILPDLATVRDLATSKAKKVLYGVLALGWRGSVAEWQNQRIVYAIMSAIMAPMVISVHSVVGLDFAAGLTPGWHDTQFPPYFFFGAVISGTAVIVMLTILVRWGYSLQNVLTEYHFNAMAKVMLVGSLMLAYAYVWEAFGPLYTSDVAERTEFFHRAFGFTAPLFWSEKFLTVVVPQLLWLPVVRRNQLLLFLISGGIIIGMWQERVVFTTASLEHNYMPSYWGYYFPTVWDWATLAGTIGLFLTLFFLFLRFAPIISLAEVREIVEEGKSK
ncbi:NrfD/PsrC family molybdoenzyme membrane anchor subunit [Bradyrhizobium sp.]|uniref:NrfD/PsrC family molybdoenzyme membrane anchor subunit n=1 Tax=Bradyrhizobium sp. TaxID=376 RepID=UPI002390222C|nr:NrfD/PsrC family molybdoenzyme membrane anchor subunit [Bradyrhizobium sp.]MDE1932807.1 polysulfide reductase NrfD [Bradyrhizobium sp.]